jgi:hypothetical protein
LQQSKAIQALQTSHGEHEGSRSNSRIVVSFVTNENTASIRFVRATLSQLVY